MKLSLNATICLFLVLFTVAPYWQITKHDFIAFDDDVYVVDNHNIHNGFSFNSLSWAFTTMYGANWHPMTWLSHILDVELFGFHPGGHHATNLILHIANTLILFCVLRKTTGCPWRSGVVAGLFAIHPLHVEVVAQVAQRKDILSTFFGFMVIWVYYRYLKKPSLPVYFLLLVLYGFGLMSKPMLVTLPFVLLLLDYWPLGRFKKEQTIQKAEGRFSNNENTLIFKDKIPLFILMAASCAITFIAQRSGGAVRSFEAYPIYARIGNAIVAYSEYIFKALWPSGLAFYYPHPRFQPFEKILLGYALLVFILVFAWRLRKRYPYLIVGWMWFIGTLVPVIGLVQVGTQSMADRYTYVPLIGLFIIVVWGAADLAGKLRIGQRLLTAVVVVMISMYSMASYIYASYWADSVKLFEHAIEVTEKNEVALINLGTVFQEAGRLDEAIQTYSEVIDINPKNAKAHNNLGSVYEKIGNYKKALNEYQTALRIDPVLFKAHYNIGVLMERLGNLDQAIHSYQQAISLFSNFADAHANIGGVLLRVDKLKQGISHIQKAIEIDPMDAGNHNNLAVGLYLIGSVERAIWHLERALKLDPDNADARRNLNKIRAANSSTTGTNETDAVRAYP